MLRAARSTTVAAAFALLSACGAEDQVEPEPPLPPPGCVPGELTLPDGSCQPAGVPADGCAPGFESDGDHGCRAILPADPCPEGLIAVPGDESCRELMACGEGPWGEIPVDATTQHVDASFAGPTSDGSPNQPWTNIGEGIAAAAPGAIVAVAEGLYTENVEIRDQPVRLWGRCPPLVEIHGAQVWPTVVIGPGADAAELRGVALTGGRRGVAISGVAAVLVESVWIHDTPGGGVDLQDTLGPADATIRNVLAERTRDQGGFFRAVDALIEASAFRDTWPLPDGMGGVGVWIQDNSQTLGNGTVQITGSLIERSRDLGVFIGGANATVEATLVRDTAPLEVDGTYGRGVEVIDNPVTGARPTALLRGVVVERSWQEGVFMAGADLTVEDTVVRDTESMQADGRFGRGVSVEPDPSTAAPNSLVLRRSLVERSHEHGLYVSFGPATVESTRVRDTLPNAAESLFGRGVEVHDSPEGPATMDLRHCVVERNVEVGVFAGANATVEATWVSDTAASAQHGLLGDGIVVRGLDTTSAELTVTDSHVERSVRVGIAAFGAAVLVGTSELVCNAIDLAGQDVPPLTFQFTDLGGNRCGCDAEFGDCQLLHADLEPPAPVASDP